VHEVVKRCPTGALTVRQKDGTTDIEPAGANQVTVSNRGPLYVTGDLKIAAAEDDMLGTTRRAALCRCGQSKNKPFCDNAHESADFNDRGAVGQSGEELPAEAGPLEINPAPNGPLLLSGPLTILSSAGRPAWSGTSTALCRCGQSKNAPFCDGSHKTTGFKAD